MIRKTVFILLISVLLFNYLYSNSASQVLAKPLKIKLKGEEKFKTYLLCFTEKGFVIWNSSMYYNPDDIPKYAEYHTFEELDYFQLPGKVRIYPLIVSLGLSVITLTGTSGSGTGAIGALILSSIFLVAGSILTLGTAFIPSRVRPEMETDNIVFPWKYYSFKGKLPAELQEFVDQHEK